MGSEDEEGGVRGMEVLFGPDHGGDVEGEMGLIEGDGAVVLTIVDADADRAVGAEEELVAGAVGVFSADWTGDVVDEEDALRGEGQGGVALTEDSEWAAVVAVLAEGDELAVADAEGCGGSLMDEVAAGLGCQRRLWVQGVHWFTDWMMWSTWASVRYGWMGSETSELASERAVSSGVAQEKGACCMAGWSGMRPG